MSGLLKTQVQLGDSATATQNFTLTSAAADGTMKLARGNYGATSQDILTVAADGSLTAAQNLSVPAATAAAHAVRKDQSTVGGDAFSAYLPTANQSVTSGVVTKVTLSAESFDLNSKFDSVTNYRWTPEVGYYQISWMALLYANAGTITNAYSIVEKNGGVLLYGNTYISPTGSTQFGSGGSNIVYMNGTDYLELFIQITGTSPVVVFGPSSTWFSGVLIRR